MYRYILESVENIARTKLVLGLALLSTDFVMGFKEFGVKWLASFSALRRTLRTIPGIAQILDISEEVLLSLTELASVLELVPTFLRSMDSPHTCPEEGCCQGVNFFHASFDDFLKDPTRSKEFYISMEDFHHRAAKGCLRILARLSCLPNFPNNPVMEYAIQAMMIHFSKAKLTKGLLNNLGEFDFRWWLNYNIRWHQKLFPFLPAGWSMDVHSS